jgi:hypothetical protein
MIVVTFSTYFYPQYTDREGGAIITWPKGKTGKEYHTVYFPIVLVLYSILAL